MSTNRKKSSSGRNKFVVLEETDDEYQQVKQYLSACLMKKASITDVKMVKIDNPELVSRFEKRSQKLIKLVGWTNMKHLHSDNCDLSVLGNRGFVVSKGTSGLDFTVGNINSVSPIVRAPDTHINVKTEIHEPEHTFIYSDVAIGRAFVRDKNFNTILFLLKSVFISEKFNIYKEH